MAAINRLYPPSIAGTIPSFYTTNTGTSLEVPFSMNVTVSNAAVKGMRLRLKTTSTDIVIANIFSQKYGDDAQNRSVIYELTDDIVAKLVVGNFYKVQLAYVDQAGNDGYYSTVAIVKYTAKPIVEIAGLNMQSVTAVSNTSFVGTYQNEDASEKVYQYRFVFSNAEGVELQNTGWLIHNTQTDTELDSSSDECLLAFNLVEGETYRIQYSIITNNGLMLNTVNYEITQTAVSISTLNVYIRADIDTENARVILNILPEAAYLLQNKLEEYPLLGNFVISRRDLQSEKQLWETIAEVPINMALTKTKGYQYIDYAIESGAKYMYSIQKVNSKNIYSKRVSTANVVIPTFEDAFLYDGTRQLRIRFNPKISSFKSVVSETKKTTLGRQFPFILRNGILNYKEFPIAGLISYHIDNDELFMKKTELDAGWILTGEALDSFGDKNATQTRSSFIEPGTSLSDANFTYERKFKLAVLDWLNNGQIKLFKSPQEGSYIVRLTNISLTPNDTVSRLLHSFNCTASEVDRFNVSTLANYSLLNEQNEVVHIDTTRIVNLRELGHFLGSAAALSEYDLTEGVGCRKVQFVYNLNLDEDGRRADTYGMSFEWGEYNFAINKTGLYELELETYSTAPLRYINPPNVLNNIEGYLILTVENIESDNLEAIQNVQSQTLVGYSLYGLEEPQEEYTYEIDEFLKNDDGSFVLDPVTKEKVYKTRTEIFSRNLFEGWNGLKGELASVVYIIYRSIPVYQCGYNTLSYVWNQTLSYGDWPAALQYGSNIILQKGDGTYWQYVPKASHTIVNPSTGKYPTITDADFKQINYGTRILFGSDSLDAIELFDANNSSEGLSYYRYELPLNVRGKLDLRVQNGVQVYVYAKAETRTYALEEQYGNMDNFTELELRAYEDYLAARFNFTVFADPDPNNKIPLSDEDNYNFFFAFHNRQMVEINKIQLDSYYQGGYRIYIQNYPTIIAEQQVQELYETWLDRRTQLNNYLATVLVEKDEAEMEASE